MQIQWESTLRIIGIGKFSVVTQTYANKELSSDESWNEDMKDLTAGEQVS